MLIGYARVSKKDQDLTLQIASLKKAGCSKIYEDKKTGSSDAREGLKQALTDLRPNDTLVVWKLDRLGRSIKHLLTIVNQLRDSKVNFHSLTDHINTSTTSGRFFFNVMASLAEMERKLITERTIAGLESAKAQGRTGGRQRKMTDSKLQSAKQLLSSGSSPRDVAGNLGVSLKTLYRWIPASASFKHATL